MSRIAINNLHCSTLQLRTPRTGRIEASRAFAVSPMDIRRIGEEEDLFTINRGRQVDTASKIQTSSSMRSRAHRQIHTLQLLTHHTGRMEARGLPATATIATATIATATIATATIATATIQRVLGCPNHGRHKLRFLLPEIKPIPSRISTLAARCSVRPWDTVMRMAARHSPVRSHTLQDIGRRRISERMARGNGRLGPKRERGRRRFY